MSVVYRWPIVRRYNINGDVRAVCLVVVGADGETKRAKDSCTSRNEQISLCGKALRPWVFGKSFGKSHAVMLGLSRSICRRG